jgi:DNA polymerase I
MPPPGCGVAYVDWSQQEFGIAAALSGDPMMMEAYRSGDPYLAFAKQAGAVPHDATKASHNTEREQYKACVLAVQYGMGEAGLGQPDRATAHSSARIAAAASGNLSRLLALVGCGG